MSDWAHPDFSDPRFGVYWVDAAARCRHAGCDRLAEHLVGYWMRRAGWTYDYECGYCDEHLPAEVRAKAERAMDDSPARSSDTPNPKFPQ